MEKAESVSHTDACLSMDGVMNEKMIQNVTNHNRA